MQIAAALVHDPDLLILDEPFSGLDPIAVDTVLGVLRAVFDLEPGNEDHTDQRVLHAALARGMVTSFTPVVPSLNDIFKEAI